MDVIKSLFLVLIAWIIHSLLDIHYMCRGHKFPKYYYYDINLMDNEGGDDG